MDPVSTLRAALAGPHQVQRLLRLHTSLGSEVLVAERLQGREQIDGPGFCWDITALSVDAGLAIGTVLGQGALLELQQADGSYRPLHGRITAAQRIGSNGGLARYRLRLQPWLALLGHRRDSYVFQDMTVMAIVDDLLADYADVAASWRWALDDAAFYAKRSLTTQYQETDLAFLQRLLAEEGIYYWFEHSAGDDGEFGKHTLVLTDNTHAAEALGTVRYHRRDEAERADSVQHWQPAFRWRTHEVQRGSWDHRTLTVQQASASASGEAGLGIRDDDTGGPYGWQDSSRGQRRAQQHLDARRVSASTVAGQGQWRALRPGGRFALSQHPGVAADAEFLCLRVDHAARNNLDADVFDAIEQLFAPEHDADLALPEALVDEGARPDMTALDAHLYENTFEVIPAEVVYRPQTEDGHGLRLHPRPSIQGSLSAIVVSDGGPLLSDRDQRIKVQFPWQRGADSSTALAHPGGDDNASANGGAWTWVRVMTPWAGDNWGGMLVPRRGQEVLVSFLEGDIDRPVVVGTLYNGVGQTDAAHNQLSSGGATATGNAAAWFEGNDHQAVFTGFKSQALADSQGGSGGFQQLRLDDTPGEGRAQLSTTQHETTLTLGHLKGGKDNLRGDDRGHGVELSTAAHGALRAGKGLLLATEAGKPQLAAAKGLSQLQEGHELLQALAESALNQQATLPGEPATLPVDTLLAGLREELATLATGSAAERIGGGDGQAPGWSAPVLLGSGQAGVLSVTPQDQVWISGTHTVLASNVAMNWLTQGALTVAVANGLVLYAAGEAAAAQSPNQETGIALHAAQGKVSARAHKDAVKVAAKVSVQVVSTAAGIEMRAPAAHLQLAAVGAQLKIAGDSIELLAPGKVEFNAGQRNWTGAASASAEAATPAAEGKLCPTKAAAASASGSAVVAVG